MSGGGDESDRFAGMFEGALFAQGYLCEGILESPFWREGEESFRRSEFGSRLRSIYERFVSAGAREAHTEDDAIWPIMRLLGWEARLRQRSLALDGRDIPDGVLFADEAAKKRGLKLNEERRSVYEEALCLVEAKRWGEALDRGVERGVERGVAPSSQMLRYLRGADDVTQGKMRWGILTDGRFFRLYHQGAPSVSEGFLEIDAYALALGSDGAFASDGREGGGDWDEEARSHGLRVFWTMFGREAFLKRPDGRSFHLQAIAQGRDHEARVAQGLSDATFNDVFPRLVQALWAAAATGGAPVDPAEARDGALILLYRLLFVLYAEDRNLLPARSEPYLSYSLRGLRRRAQNERDRASEGMTGYWDGFQNLCRAIDRGDASLGLPAYNGGLFSEAETPLLSRVKLGDRTMSELIFKLSFATEGGGGSRYIDYRDLGVRQLGAIYERLLDREAVLIGGKIELRPDRYVRKDAGSYYTPDDLVKATVRLTLGPLIEERREAFAREAEKSFSKGRGGARLNRLEELDPAAAILRLKICDPAMGSGHFLIRAVDFLADGVISAMARAPDEAKAGAGKDDDETYRSPVANCIAAIRDSILTRAREEGWAVDEARLDDRRLVRRMVLKRCVYGVDKNPQAVELAKLSLWLHSFTVGAPLSFLDHHLRCGDALFGFWLAAAHDALEGRFNLFSYDEVRKLSAAEQAMKGIEDLFDIDLDEAERSKSLFTEMAEKTKRLDGFLTTLEGMMWREPPEPRKRKAFKAALSQVLDGFYGDPVALGAGEAVIDSDRQGAAEDAPGSIKSRMEALAKARAISAKAAERLAEKRAISAEAPPGSTKAREELWAEIDAQVAEIAELLEGARAVAAEENFLNWQLAFPGVWENLISRERKGGFDAVIGNPPWDRIKLQKVEWFASRHKGAGAANAAARARMIARLEAEGDPLADAFHEATARAMTRMRRARMNGDYPLLSRGDVNLYALFVERATGLVKKESGRIGLLTPSGIASDFSTSAFFRAVTTQGRLCALYDFENRNKFFPDVDSRFKFCLFAFAMAKQAKPARCGFFLRKVADIDDNERCFAMSAEDFTLVNPNTGTAPVFRTSRDAELTTDVYRRLPIVANKAGEEEIKAWPVRYMRMFDMANDSGLFRTQTQLREEEGAWAIPGGRFENASGAWRPLYVGRMIRQFDHRAASVVVNPDNVHNKANSQETSDEDRADPAFLPTPQYWIPAAAIKLPPEIEWVIGYRDVTNTTNARTMIAAIVPRAGAGDKLPLLTMNDLPAAARAATACLILGNLNALVFDYVTRNKFHTTSLKYYIFGQLPVIPLDRYEEERIGDKSAGDLVRESVLELTYTADDLAPFARDLGHIGADGEALPPFRWDAGRRLRLRARLDALYFLLYGIVDHADIRFIYDSFPIVKRDEEAAFGAYRSRDLCLDYLNALLAGRPEAAIAL